jgi:hypothetical protein
MSRFHFQPDGRRRGRQRYLGRLVEPTAEPIPLPYTSASLRILVEGGATQRDNGYSHHAIARWCGEAAAQWRELESPTPSLPLPGQITGSEIAVAEDIDAQFDLFLFNTYSPQVLADVDLDSVRLPCEWFDTWLGQLGRSAPIEDRRPDV